MDWKVSQRFSIGFNSGKHGGHQWYQFLHSLGTACILLPHEVGHYHAPGGTQDPLHRCRVWQQVQAFHNVTYGSDLCLPPWICLTRPSLTHQQSGYAEQSYSSITYHWVYKNTFLNQNIICGWIVSTPFVLSVNKHMPALVLKGNIWNPSRYLFYLFSWISCRIWLCHICRMSEMNK